MDTKEIKKKRIFAAASFGGHWKQLLRITKPLEERFEVVYASTHPKSSMMIGSNIFYLIGDFNRKDAWRMVPAFFRLLLILHREHPSAVLTTGAAPGLICVLAGCFLRYKTIWVDSSANIEHLSVCGRIARHFVSRIYTQWPDLAGQGIVYAGNVWGEVKCEKIEH